MDMTVRPRRLRTTQTLRKMVRETRMDKSSLVYPMFVKEGENVKEEIALWKTRDKAWKTYKILPCVESTIYPAPCVDGYAF